MIIALTLSLVKTGKKNAVVALEFSVLEKSGSKARAHGDRVKPGFTTGLGNHMISGDPVENPVASTKSPVLVSRHEAIEGVIVIAQSGTDSLRPPS